MKQLITDSNVPNLEHYKSTLNTIVLNLVQNRKLSHQTQDNIADWLGVTRKAIVNLENGLSNDFELLLRYAHKFDIEVKIKIINH